jgi:hypothetical protein
MGTVPMWMAHRSQRPKKSAVISMIVPMPSGLCTAKRLKLTTKLSFKVCQRIWMESPHSCVSFRVHVDFSSTDPRFYRPAYLLPFSLPSSSTVSRICNRTLHNKLYIITSSQSPCLPRSLSRSRLSPPRFPFHPLPHHLTPHSTHRFQTSE